MRTQLYDGFITEVANRIYTHVIDEQLAAGRNQFIETKFGLSPAGWLEANVDVETRETFDKGDYLTPDYSTTVYTDICLRSAYTYAGIDDDGEEIDSDFIKDINQELARLCA